MNAFLIFCKRHRASVRSSYPHLENRAVTRVLGEWWATLHPDQKRSYTNLAQEVGLKIACYSGKLFWKVARTRSRVAKNKTSSHSPDAFLLVIEIIRRTARGYNYLSGFFFQYKDAFLNANPDFKWYKLPAPPLRTLNTRPTNKKQESSNNSNNTQPADSVKSEYESSDCTKSDRRDGQSIQPGKLADESQIGGLSSLFTPQKTESEEQITVNGITIENDVVPKPPKKRYTESPFQGEQKRDCKADLFGEKKRKRAESNNNEQHETVRIDLYIRKNADVSSFSNCSFELLK